jgi:8-oxo-dGTP pyrophosphatase MutT (NUDIX family)
VLSKSKFRYRASAICLDEEKVLMVLLRDPKTGSEFWVPPGGQVESGETPQTAAARETLEETGFEITLSNEEPVSADYKFTWNGETYDCRTDFFLCQLKGSKMGPRPVHDQFYVLKAAWFPVQEAIELLSFHEEIQRAVSQCLRKT